MNVEPKTINANNQAYYYTKPQWRHKKDSINYTILAASVSLLSKTATEISLNYSSTNLEQLIANGSIERIAFAALAAFCAQRTLTRNIYSLPGFGFLYLAVKTIPLNLPIVDTLILLGLGIVLLSDIESIRNRTIQRKKDL